METKEMKITPVKCTLSDRKLSNGGKIYDLLFKPAGVDMEMSGATFSDTLAKAFEDNYNKEVDSKWTVRQFNGRPSYNLQEIAGVQKGQFKGSRGVQKDVVSIERQSSAKTAIELMQVLVTDSKKLNIKEWEKIADAVYAWVSKRPSEPQAAGGETPQKTEGEGDPNDIPFKD